MVTMNTSSHIRRRCVRLCFLSHSNTLTAISTPVVYSHPWLLRDLVDLGLWDDNMNNMIIAHNGSIQNIPYIPDDVKAVYKTVREISQKKILDLAADRGAFICQCCRPHPLHKRLLPHFLRAI